MFVYLKIQCLEKLQHILVNIFPRFLIVMVFFKKLNINVLLILLHSPHQISFPGITLYLESLFMSLFSCKKKKKERDLETSFLE